MANYLDARHCDLPGPTIPAVFTASLLPVREGLWRAMFTGHN
jgi:hypothetical protein